MTTPFRFTQIRSNALLQSRRLWTRIFPTPGAACCAPTIAWCLLR